MITGFNTDINFEGVTYHVQTEDKGLETPLILSLVYTGGEILASKRSPYDDLISNGFDESVLTDRLNRQHKLICAAITQGRIEDLKRMTREPKSKKNAPVKVEKAEKPQVELAKTPENVAPVVVESVLSVPPIPVNVPLEPIAVIDVTPVTVVTKDNEPFLEIPIAVVDVSEATIEEPPYLISEIVDEQTLEETFEPPPQPSIIESSIDVVQLENVATKGLNISLLDDKEFRGGERIALRIGVTRGVDGTRQIISGAEIMVKVLGSAFRPQIFHAHTSENGVAIIHLQLPQFRTGRAAILIRAVFGESEGELRRIVSQR
ncbi:MAG: hypothetical protein H7Z37_08120 [Pyrinomonadaceae bacterium]|nr:hypothetical protein [Pyrinomonadaceae bacterium]